MHIYVSLMSLIYSKFEGVVIWRGGFALLTRKEVRPRLDIGLIKSVGGGAYL